MKDEYGNSVDTKAQIRQWLLDYAWLGTREAQVATVDCIMSQDGWKFISARADKFAGAQFEPGEKAFAEGVGFELSALYECHTGPHLKTCPDYREPQPEMCNCEHTVHFSDEHGPRSDHEYMSVPACERRAMYVGRVCDHCADTHYADVIES